MGNTMHRYAGKPHWAAPQSPLITRAAPQPPSTPRDDATRFWEATLGSSHIGAMVVIQISCNAILALTFAAWSICVTFGIDLRFVRHDYLHRVLPGQIMVFSHILPSEYVASLTLTVLPCLMLIVLSFALLLLARHAKSLLARHAKSIQSEYVLKNVQRRVRWRAWVGIFIDTCLLFVIIMVSLSWRCIPYAITIMLATTSKMLLTPPISLSIEASHSLVQGKLKTLDDWSETKSKEVKVTLDDWSGFITDHQGMVDEINEFWSDAGKLVTLSVIPILPWIAVLFIPAYYGIMAGEYVIAMLCWMCIFLLVVKIGVDLYRVGEITDLCRQFRWTASKYYYHPDVMEREASKVYPSRFIDYLDIVGEGGVRLWLLGTWGTPSIKKYAGLVLAALPGSCSLFAVLSGFAQAVQR